MDGEMIDNRLILIFMDRAGILRGLFFFFFPVAFCLIDKETVCCGSSVVLAVLYGSGIFEH